MDDVVDVLDRTFPLKVEVPYHLQVSKDCLDTSADACFKSCAVAPMLFVDWRDTFAYGLCGLSVGWCRSLASYIGQSDPVSNSLLAKALIVEAGDPVLLTSMQFCFGVTSTKLTPLIVLFILALSVSSYIVYLPFLLFPRLVTICAQALAYTHS
jgi:hypothetical protein